MMIKRLLPVLLCAVIALCLPFAASAEEAAALPQPGDVVSGFKVISVEPTEVLGATSVLFEHEKSGAKLLYLACADTNRSFDITFRTPALDNTGKPHVFEHITISGSQKYPDANLFFPFANQTYNTFVNAMTYHGMTTFPVASLSEEQLMTMMDYYFSGVFQPLLYTEPRLQMREAWRYELASADAPLSITGTVYSEMQGAMTAQSYATFNDLRTLYAGSPVAYESGGLPDDIRTLTYEDLIAFHDTYYHPSNALIVLYGDLDYEQFLSFIDSEYLSAYDRKDVYVEMGRIEPYTETRYATWEVPVEADAQTDDASYLNYSFALDGADLTDMFGARLLTSVLGSEALPFMQNARAQLPNASVGVYTSFDSPTPKITFYADGVNESDRDTFVSLVDDAIRQIGESGIPADELDSALSTSKLGLMLTAENQDLGYSASTNIALCWTYFDDLSYYNTYERVLNSADQAYLDGLVQTMLAGNAYRAVSVTKPVAGKAEENAALLDDELAKTKAGMSAEEIDALVAQYTEFTDWSGKEPDAELVAKLCSVAVDNLPEEVPHYEVADDTVDGVRYLTAEADLAGVASVKLLLDASTLPIDKLHDVNAYLLLLGSLDTDAHTREELDTLITRYMPNFGTYVSVSTGYYGAEDLYNTAIQFRSLTEDFGTTVGLVREILTETHFDDMDTIRAILTRERNATRDLLDGNPISVQVSRCYATLYTTLAYKEYCSGKLYYDYLGEMIALCDTDPAAFTARMAEAKELVMNRHGAIATYAGGRDAIEACQAVVPSIFEDMADVQRDKVDYSPLKLSFKSELLVNNLTVHMNILMAKSEDYSGKDAVISSLISDMYMLPQLRNMYGAYGAYANYDLRVGVLYTYRDPNCAQSFDIFAKLPDYLRTAELTQDVVDRYIIGSYTGLSRPEGALSGAMTAISNKLCGITEETRLQTLREAKATTVEDVRAFADKMDALQQNGVLSTSGTASFATEVAELFEDVVRYDDATEETEAQDDAA